MRKKDVHELHTKTRDELLKLLQDTNEELVKLTLEHLRAKLTNTNLVRGKKKDIARLLTILRGKRESEVGT